jgi:hypothetical protein
MKSFKQYITEENNPEQEEMPIYRLSGKPHLPFVEVQDSLGRIHQAPFHSELKDGKIRYDFTQAARDANAKKGFLSIGGRNVGVPELQNHHGREFRHDIFTEGGGRGLGYKGIMLMTYTPEKREDDQPPADPREPRLKKARRLGLPVPGGRKGSFRKVERKAKTKA